MHNKMKILVGGQALDAEVIQVTPQLAQLWLERNSGNRNLRSPHVAKLARSMELGEFQFVADPIRIAASGRLLDGQHRLAAVVRSGLPQTMLVVSGLDEDSQQYMDIGKLRTPADAVKLEFPDKKYADKWSAIARLLIQWDAAGMPTEILKPATPEIIQYIRDHDAELERAVDAGNAVRRGIRTGCSVAVAGTVFYLAEQRDATLAHDFWRRLSTGAGIEIGEPVYALRTALQHRRERDRWTATEEAAAYVRCWNATRAGKTMAKLQLARGEFTEATFKLR